MMQLDDFRCISIESIVNDQLVTFQTTVFYISQFQLSMCFYLQGDEQIGGMLKHIWQEYHLCKTYPDYSITVM